ncbi:MULTISPECIES: MFS transporter [Streptomyces]|uniref:MFS transporter n=1 Tax=Streptomyces chilikensis TaxID=1194079 RepID=A0ABV3EW21_9ACTN|nr:MFS transporter [Streptomyces sp. MJP52]MDH6223816.1 MFS family permease [Streptomyces sp. MJP52]
MSYRKVLTDRVCAQLALSTAVGRFAQVMFDVTVVIFVVEDLHRPAAAGLAVLLATLPGLLLSPLSGSFLQGRNVTGWMAADYVIKAAATLGIAFGASADAGGVWLLWGLALLSSLTSAFGNVAFRSYVALSLPAELRGPANGLDSMIAGLAAMAGPALAGIAVAVFGGRHSVAVVGVAFLVAALVAAASGRTTPEAGGEVGLRSAVEAVRGILVHPVLRGLTGVYFMYQVSVGVLVVTLPQLVSAGFGADSSWVGISWSIAGMAGIVASLAAGHRISDGAERRFLTIGAAVTLVGVAGLFLHSTVFWLAAMFVLLGLAVGPMDVGLLSLRQRVLPENGATAVLAVSSSLNMAGYPAGAMVGGLVAGLGLGAQTGVAAGCALAALLLCALLPAGSLHARRTSAGKTAQEAAESPTA